MLNYLQSLNPTDRIPAAKRGVKPPGYLPAGGFAFLGLPLPLGGRNSGLWGLIRAF